jgi:hypothetical protein
MPNIVNYYYYYFFFFFLRVLVFSLIRRQKPLSQNNLRDT